MLKNIVSLNLHDVAKKQKENSKWNELIDAILDGRVIPVIGPNFLIESDSDKSENHHQQIIEILTSICKIDDKISTFSQLIHNEKFKSITNGNKEIVYSLITEVIDQIKDNEQLKPNKLLVRLLQTKLFPFVITTSFSPIIENVMQKVWPDEKIRVLQFRNDSKRDQCVGEGDISNNTDFKHPTVYYMFGRYSIEPHRYVVSDMDMMEFCKAWLSGGNQVPRVFLKH